MEKTKEEKIVEILENLFILEAVKVGIPKEEIRKILRIDKNRVGKISKYIPKKSTS